MPMIHYTLHCAGYHEFEGWFKDSDAFEEQRHKKKIDCPVCGSRKIDRVPSVPNIASSRWQDAVQAKRARTLRQALHDLRRQVESTHENVGLRFAEEARKIHYGETEARGIYGEASSEEARDLLDEGIAVTPLPWIEESKEN